MLPRPLHLSYLKIMLTPGMAGAFLGVQILHQHFKLPVETIAMLIPWRCPLKLFLGISCPTCGLGRAVVSLLTGNLQASLEYHPLGVPVLFAMISGALYLNGSGWLDLVRSQRKTSGQEWD